jgi:hypothetical protein
MGLVDYILGSKSPILENAMESMTTRINKNVSDGTKSVSSCNATEFLPSQESIQMKHAVKQK